jgi:hypothetical protein
VARLRAETVLVRARETFAAAEAERDRIKAQYEAHATNRPSVPEAARVRASAMHREATLRHKHADEAARLREALRVAEDALATQRAVLEQAQRRFAATFEHEQAFDRHRAEAEATQRRERDAAEDEEQAELSGKFARRPRGS